MKCNHKENNLHIDYRPDIMYSESTAAQIGSLVCSMQGRDRGRYYLVVGLEGNFGGESPGGENYCSKFTSGSGCMIWVADGEKRKVDNPKRKNLKHLKVYNIIARLLFEKKQTGKRITDSDVRKAIKSLVESF